MRSCESLTNLALPDTTIESAVMDSANGMCLVTAIVTHPPAEDRVKVWIGLPLTNWNGRFQGTGGGGFLGGHPNSLRGPVGQGFAAGATDTGHDGGSGSFALDANGRQNWQGIIDNAYLGIHKMTVVGKAITKAFYGREPRYSYFVGGSTGGRQGLMEAQWFPDDYAGTGGSPLQGRPFSTMGHHLPRPGGPAHPGRGQRRLLPPGAEENGPPATCSSRRPRRCSSRSCLELTRSRPSCLNEARAFSGSHFWVSKCLPTSRLILGERRGMI